MKKYIFFFQCILFSSTLWTQQPIVSLQGPEELTTSFFYKNDNYIFLKSGYYLYRSPVSTIKWDTISSGVLFPLDIENNIIVTQSDKKESLKISFDSGSNWSIIENPIENLSSIKIANSTIYLSSYDQDFPYLLCTKNFGVNWDTLNIPNGSLTKLGKTENQIFTITSGKLYLLNLNNEFEIIFDKSKQFSDHIYGFYKNGNNYIVITKSEIWASIDNGGNWYLNSFVPYNFPRKIRYHKGILYIISPTYLTDNILKSEDNGFTWTSMKALEEHEQLLIDIILIDNTILITTKSQMFSYDFENQKYSEIKKNLHSSEVSAISGNSTDLYVSTFNGIHHYDILNFSWRLIARLNHPEYISDIIVSNEGTVIATVHGHNNRYYIKRKNEVSFTQKSIPISNIDFSGRKLIKLGSNIIAYKYGNAYVTSDDGNTWLETSAYGSIAILHDSIYSIDLNNTPIISKDHGITYNKTKFIDDISVYNSVFSINNELLILVANNNFYTSFDGENWNETQGLNKELTYTGFGRISFKINDTYYLKVGLHFVKSKNGIQWQIEEDFIPFLMAAHRFNNLLYLGNRGGGVYITYEPLLNTYSENLNGFINVFPNPTHDILNISFDFLPGDKLIIINNLGQCIWIGDNNKTIPLNTFLNSSGQYFIQIVRNDQVIGVTSFFFHP